MPSAENPEKYWIVIGDIHDDLSALAGIADLKDAKGIIISGDLTNEGGEKEAAEILAQLEASGLPVIGQIGNMDLLEVNGMLEKRKINLHRTSRAIDPEVAVFGIGGSTPTPMRTPTEFPEDDYAAWLEDAWKKFENYPHKVLISHNPPLNTDCDVIGDGIHVGSRAVRDFIEANQPEICICGHIHEAKGMDKIGKTVIINPGAFADGGYVRLALKDGKLSGELKQAGETK